MRTYHKFPGGVRVRLVRDIVAGLAVSFLIVPQGLSYAQVAGLPAQYGLCARPAPPARAPGSIPAASARLNSPHARMRWAFAVLAAPVLSDLAPSFPHSSFDAIFSNEFVTNGLRSSTDTDHTLHRALRFVVSQL